MIIYVTNRKLCRESFLRRIEQLASGRPDGIILREKDLSCAEYEKLAANIKEVCEKYGVDLIINQNVAAALNLQIKHIQLSMENLRKHQTDLQHFRTIGASVHSVEEAIEAQNLGATRLIAGHIFQTSSKNGLPPRGLSFLKQVCRATSLPVLAIGGVSEKNAKEVLAAGAIGICLMSEPMTCPNPEQLTKQLKQCF